MERLPAIVLAAGASRRMGRSKPLLRVGGRPCLERVLDAFREAGQGPLILVLGCRAREILGGIRQGRDIIPVVNGRWELGQTSSVKAGLRAAGATAPGCFVMPGDHPLLEAADVAALARRIGKPPGSRGIFVPSWRGRRGHPLLLGAEHRLAILGMDDAVPLHTYLRMRSADRIEVPAGGPGVLSGMNNATEHMAALRAAEGGGGDHRR